VDFIGNEGDECLQEFGGLFSGCSLDPPGKSKLGGAIHSHEKQEFVLLSADLGGIDVEVGDGIVLELFLGSGPMALQLRQPADAMTLKAAMQGGTGELWDGGLQGVETVVQGQ
jgi:hypothetical protein